MADGSHFSFAYGPDGRLDGVSLGKRLHGRWRAANDQLCEMSDGPEICFDVEVRGAEATLIQSGTDIARVGALK